MSNKPLILMNMGLVGLVIWFMLKPGTGPQRVTEPVQPVLSAGAEIEQLRQRISLLEQDLNEDIAARINLEQRLQDVQQNTSQNQGEDDFGPGLPAVGIDQPKLSQPVNQQDTLEARLIAVGIPQDTIDSMQRTVDQKQWQMLQLRDRAIREGWSDSEDFREQMSELRNPFQGLREEFGDEAYDQYLYATDTPNRVQVQEVYSGSAADDAGLLPGDIIVSYASDPIYSMSTLRQSTLEGVAGETILLEVNRDGSPLTASVPRGPLGITMTGVVVKPE